MLINIPIQIDDNVLEGRLSAEYEDKLLLKIGARVEGYLKSKDPKYSYYSNSKNANDGLEYLINKHINELLCADFEDIKQKSIEAARKDIINKLQHTKEFKQLKPETMEVIKKIFEDEENIE